jgi:hypothetical protein
MRVEDIDGAVAMLPGWPSTVAAATEQLIAALPTSLHSFSFSIRLSGSWNQRCAQFETLGVALLAAATTMTRLTELSIVLEASWDDMRLDAIVALPRLRKLSLNGHGFDVPLSRLKALSQLRELKLEQVDPADVLLLFQPPHLLQLEAFTTDVWLNEVEMRALLSVPTLTRLEPSYFFPDAWPLLAQFPHLRCLNFATCVDLSAEGTASLSTVLARCVVLEDLTLSFNFSETMSEEEQHACWSIFLPSMPNLRRLTIGALTFLAPFIDVLPEHLPRLEQLAFGGW